MPRKTVRAEPDRQHLNGDTDILDLLSEPVRSSTHVRRVQRVHRHPRG